jgi:hypothetical protein
VSYSNTTVLKEVENLEKAVEKGTDDDREVLSSLVRRGRVSSSYTSLPIVNKNELYCHSWLFAKGVHIYIIAYRLLQHENSS